MSKKYEPFTEKLSGKVAIVTGATGGIGKEIARNLARLQATVVLGVRDVAKGEAVARELSTETGNASISVLKVDTSSMKSVRAFAAEFQSRHDRLSLLVNNAGAWFSDRRESVDGYELTFATNVLGPYLLTELLLPSLKAGAPARVLNVASGLAANYDATDLGFQRRKYDGFKVYAQSKQALRMLTFGAAKRLEGTGVTVNAVAPGFVKTDFNRNAAGFVAGMINVMAGMFGVTPAQGADTPTWAAVSAEVEGRTGRYFDGRRDVESKFREPGPIGELEEICARLVAGEGSGPLAVTVGASATVEPRA